jgi:SpoVK/Ycf46/Vps4 family AAA+-type ATPase
MENNKNFLKIGNKIAFKPIIEGLEYELEPGKVYTIDIDRYTDDISFIVAPDLVMPDKLYETEDSSRFVNKVINYFNKSTDGTTGVMLSGLKGSGKTITAKNIALKSNLPIILIDKSFRPSLLVKLFNKLVNTPACILFDEVDKLGEDYDDDYLLRILDGANTAGKKLVLCTCNEADDINEYLKDRCSRIRYWKEFDELSPSLIQEILKDRLNDKTEIGPVTDFIISNFACISFDNIVSFVDEINEYPTVSFEELFADMNLSSK